MNTISAKEYKKLYKIDQKEIKFEINEVHKKAITLLNPQKGEKIVDLGCGTGEVVKLLSDIGVEAVGVDYMEEFLEVAIKNNPSSTFILADIRKLPFENESFDKFSCLGTLVYLSKNDMKLVLYEINRILKTNGIGIIRVGTSINKIGRFFLRIYKRESIFHSYLYSQKFYENFFKDAGFEIVKIEKSLDKTYRGTKKLFFKVFHIFFASTWFIVKKNQ
jgi:ubiquinone/menaquinone biosynthesis C-methylase UbiE